MVFDKEEQRKIILEILDNVTIPGKSLDVLFAFKQEVLQGSFAQKLKGINKEFQELEEARKKLLEKYASRDESGVMKMNESKIQP